MNALTDQDAGAVDGFVAEVAAVARSIDPMLAVLLGETIEPAPSRRWTKGRRSGLEFCLTMLGYARSEAIKNGDSRRIDRAISHIVLELARFQMHGAFARR